MKPPARSPGRLPGPPPDAARLREAALNHLARFAASEASVKAVLMRRIARWASRAAQAGLATAEIERVTQSARAALPDIMIQLRTLGAVDDQAFAQSRVRRLARGGKSQRASLAHLIAKGVDPDLAAANLPPDPARDLASACMVLRRRHLPPFGVGDRLKALGVLARAGFERAVAEQALNMEPDAAENLVRAARQ